MVSHETFPAVQKSTGGRFQAGDDLGYYTGICNSAVASLATVTVTHTHFCRTLPELWRWQALRHRYQTSHIFHCSTTVPDGGGSFLAFQGFVVKA